MALHWQPFESFEDIERIKKRSQEVPCLIFKHSDRCNISAIAQYRLEDDWDFGPGEMEAYFLDVLKFRPVSLKVAETFQVHHESPQVLLIMDGACIYDASHLDITLAELREGLTA
ncbi:MAG: bacillithiol system redox-active protein YtxJ [Phycisphaerae bacterium]|nr:bacillithiol system redox-active protein YtxJ [Saprospiraceae bacterium]